MKKQDLQKGEVHKQLIKNNNNQPENWHGFRININRNKQQSRVNKMRLFSIQKTTQNNGPDLPKYDWPKKPEKTQFMLTKSQDFLDGRQDIFDLLTPKQNQEIMTK